MLGGYCCPLRTLHLDEMGTAPNADVVSLFCIMQRLVNGYGDSLAACNASFLERIRDFGRQSGVSATRRAVGMDLVARLPTSIPPGTSDGAHRQSPR
jgi:hypothetical protein